MSQLLEYHLPYAQVSTLTGQRQFIIDATHDVWIKSMEFACIDIAPAAGKYGYAYLWRDVNHYTLMMPIVPGAPLRMCKDFGSDYLLLPANNDLCIEWVLDSTMSLATFGADITYMLAV